MIPHVFKPLLRIIGITPTNILRLGAVVNFEAVAAVTVVHVVGAAAGVLDEDMEGAGEGVVGLTKMDIPVPIFPFGN